MQGAFNLFALLLVLSALFGWLNARFLRLPRTIGLVVIALVVSLAILAVDGLSPGTGLGAAGRQILSDIDLNETLMNGMLSFLLFAGALHVDLDAMRDRRWAIGVMATLGVVLSTAIIGVGMWLVLDLAGAPLALVWCFVFGALIAPTDPVAVMGIIGRLPVPASLKAKIAGESLFNDGVGVVVFAILVVIATGGGEGGVPPGAGDIVVLFLTEAGGGALLGLLAGGIAFLALRSLDDYVVEVIVTLALVTGAWTVAGLLHLSGPIAVVVAGLLVGNHGRRLAMSETTRLHLLNFWELLDEILNALLFLLIGLEVLAIGSRPDLLWLALPAIPLVLLARFISVALPIRVLELFREPFTPGAVRVLTWGGLRGGISVALALSLPPGEARETILAMCYGVVIFSVIVQGLTIGPLIRRIVPAAPAAPAAPDAGDDSP